MIYESYKELYKSAQQALELLAAKKPQHPKKSNEKKSE